MISGFVRAMFCLIVLGLPWGAGALAQGRDIQAGGFVTSLSDVKPNDGSFSIGLYIWFLDPAGTFDIERDISVNARSLSLSSIYTEPAPTGGTYTYARLDAVVPQEYNYDAFPFDRQRLQLRIDASDSVNYMRFVPDADDSGIASDRLLNGWTVDGMSVEVENRTYGSNFGYWTDRDSAYDQLVVSVDVTRKRSPVLIDDFLGFTFAFIVTGLTFLLSCTDVGMRVGMTTGSLFAAVVNLNRLHDAAGFRPGFAMVDRLAFLVLGAIVGSLLITIFTHRMSKHDVQRANRIDTILGTGLLVVIGLLIVVTVGLEL